MAYRGQSGEWLFWSSLAVVTIVHALLAYLVFTYSRESHGAIEIQTAAISINLEASDILDAVEQSASTEQTAAGFPGGPAQEIPDEPGPVEKVAEPAKVKADPPFEPNPVEEQPVPAEAEPEPQTETVTKTEIEPAPPSESIEQEPSEDSTLQEAEDALERAMQVEIKRHEEAERKTRLEPKTREYRKKLAREQERHEERRKKRTARNTYSGAGGSSNSRSSSARVSASTGSIRNYASIIRSRIARNKPPSRLTGKVVFALSLSTSGRLRSARIIRSSGNRTLDKQALSAVRRAAPFPRAPAGISSNQLSYIEVPFNFRR